MMGNLHFTEGEGGNAKLLSEEAGAYISLTPSRKRGSKWNLSELYHRD